MPESKLIACHDCDYLHEISPLNPREQAYCVRCGAKLGKYADISPATASALTATGLILWLLAMTLPIASVMMQGHEIPATLYAIVQTLNTQQYTTLAFLVIFTLGIAPMLELCAISYMLWQSNLKTTTSFNHHDLALAKKLRKLIKPWVLVDVFMLGVLVALVKLKSIVVINLHAGLWAFIGLMLILYYLSLTLTIHHDNAS
jgi:paraquat-inducible protein A